MKRSGTTLKLHSEPSHDLSVLLENTRKLQAVVQAAPLTIMHMDLEGKVLLWNQAAQQMFGWSEDQVLGKPNPFIPPGKEAEFAALFARAISGESLYGVELERRRRDGSTIHVSLCTAPLRDSKGQTTGIVALLEDITERKQAEQALKQSEVRMRALLGSIDEIVFEFAPDGTYLNIWTANDSLLSRPREQLLGRRISDVLPGPLVNAFLECLGRALTTGQAQTIEYPLQVVGGMRWFLGRLSAIPDAQGAFSTACLLARDITSRRQDEDALRTSEELNRRILESFPGGVVHVSAAGQILRANGEAVRILGLSYDHLTNRLIADFEPQTIFEDGTPCPVEAYPVIRCLRSGLPQPPTTIGVRKPDGQVVWAVFTAVPMLDPVSHQPHGAVVTFLDISERRQNEREARQHQARLDHTLRLATMGQIVAGMAHEISQPLGAIANYSRGCIRRLRDDLCSKAQLLEVLDQISQQAQRGGKIVHGLMNFVRKRQPQRIPAAINDIVRDVLQFLEPHNRQQEVAVHLELAEGLPLVLVDPVQIEQVILNLAINSVEAMRELPRREHCLTIRTQVHGPHTVKVVVEDTGPGVPAAIRSSIFDPFFTTKNDGLGMGLAISRAIVEEHQGALDVQAGGSGPTVVSFTLPAASALAQEAARSSSSL